MRKLIAVTWIVGSVAAALTLGFFLFGCCVVPFHGLLHHTLPLCSHVAGILGGDNHRPHEATQPPPRSKTDPQMLKLASLEARAHAGCSQSQLLSPAAHNRLALRNLRRLGALRVDDDIGLHTLFGTFLI